MMDPREFDEALRLLVRRQPFVPFQVQLDDGHVITIPDRPVVFCDGAATYVTPEYDMVEFTCEQVASIRPAPREAAHDQ